MPYQDEVPSFCLELGPALAVVAFWGVEQQVEDSIYLSTCVYISPLLCVALPLK